MRRDEFDMQDEAEITAFLAERSYGFLGTVSENGQAEITPFNFVYHQGAIYVHGSKIGQKMRNLRNRPAVTFVVAHEYAIVPSYFSDPKFACPATAYFKSVAIRGTAEELDDLAEKADALTAFMHKLQPEGGYEPITPEDRDYIARIRGVAVIKINVQSLTAKFKFGQNLSEEQLDNVAGQLEQRGRELDAETAELMRRYCPHHRSTS